MKVGENTEDIPEIQQQEPESETVEESRDAAAVAKITIPEAPVSEPKEIVQEPPPDGTSDKSENSKTETSSKQAPVPRPDETEARPPLEQETVAEPEKPVKGATSIAEPVWKTETDEQPERHIPQQAGDDTKSGIYTKLTVIIIGFLLIIFAGFYVNSRLSVMKYQDKIIRNYIEDVNTKTETILKQQKILEQKMDSLNLLLSKKKVSESKESMNSSPAGTNRENMNK